MYPPGSTILNKLLRLLVKIITHIRTFQDLKLCMYWSWVYVLNLGVI